MKKLLSIAAATALLFTSVSAIDTITITGEVLPSAVVGFTQVNGETLTGTDKFMTTSIALGSHEVDVFDDTLENATQNVYVKTNIATALGHNVTMAITSNHGDNLVNDADSTATFPVVYKLGTSEFVTDNTPLTVASAANAGSDVITTFTVETDAANNQLAGTYSALLTVLIAAN